MDLPVMRTKCAPSFKRMNVLSAKASATAIRADAGLDPERCVPVWQNGRRIAIGRLRIVLVMGVTPPPPLWQALSSRTGGLPQSAMGAPPSGCSTWPVM